MKFLTPSLFIIFLLTLSACQSAPAAVSPTHQPVNWRSAFLDDFSTTNSGWTRHSDANYVNDYDNGGYRIHIVNHLQSALWGILDRQFGNDVAVDTDIRFDGGSAKNDMGVICRFIDSQNYYFLAITSNGSFGISKVVKGVETLIGMDEMPHIDNVILPGQAINHIHAECLGSSLVLVANNTELERVDDSDLPSGGVGLFVGTYSDPEINVWFDNFTVSTP